MITGRENSALLPLISDPTFSPTLAHQISRSETSGGVCCLSCNFFLSPEPLRKSLQHISIVYQIDPLAPRDRKSTRSMMARQSTTSPDRARQVTSGTRTIAPYIEPA